MNSSYARVAGTASLMGAVDILLAIGVAGIVTPGYDATRDVISLSQLGPYGAFVTIGLAVGGAMTILLALMLHRLLPDGSRVGPVLLGLRGWGTLIGAAFLADVGPVNTLGGFLHVTGFAVGTLCFGLGLFFIAVRMGSDETWRPLAPYTVATGLGTLAIFGLFVALGPRYVGDTAAPLSMVGGAIERLLTVAAWGWHLVLGVWLFRLMPTAART
jgi:hypothetical protein